MPVREIFGWVAALALSLAILLVWNGPLWSVLFVAVVAVLFVVVQSLPAERLKKTRGEVVAETFAGTAVWLRLVVPLVGFGIAAVQGDGAFVVFFVLAAATLVLALLAFQVFGT